MIGNLAGSLSSAARVAVRQGVILELPASGVADLPGPAAGFVRLWDAVTFLPDNPASTVATVSVTIEPSGLPLASGLSSGAAGIATSVVPQPIGVGETLRVTNGSAVAGRVYSNYVDVPSPLLTLVRQPLTEVATTIIAAPTAGRVRRWVVFPRINSTEFSTAAVLRFYNRDTAAVLLDFYFGAVICSRQSSLAAAAQTGPINPLGGIHVTAATGALSAATRTAPATTAPVLYGAWEEVSL